MARAPSAHGKTRLAGDFSPPRLADLRLALLADVLTDTLRIADRIGAEARLIRSGYDVDTIADLQRLEADLHTTSPEIGAHVRRWFSARS